MSLLTPIEYLDVIRQDPTLTDYICEECKEHASEYKIHKSFKENEKICFSVDKFYNDQGLSETPPSVDCLLLQACKTNRDEIHIYLVELKDRNRNTGLDRDNIRSKFKTSLYEFLGAKINPPDYFKYKVRLILVTKKNIMRSSATYDYLMSLGHFICTLNGKRIFIEFNQSESVTDEC